MFKVPQREAAGTRLAGGNRAGGGAEATGGSRHRQDGQQEGPPAGTPCLTWPQHSQPSNRGRVPEPLWLRVLAQGSRDKI